MKNLKPIDYIFTACLFLIGLTFIWRAFYGVNYNDEMYYADSLYRLFQGDVYLVHDWQLHLMSCIPAYPFYALFRLITGSNDGVILFLRILYVIFQLTVALVCFLRLRHLKWGGLLVSLLYLLFTPFNIASMSYNTMGLGFAMLTFAILSGPKKHPARDYVFCGICFALCVLSNPFAIILYFLYAAVCTGQFILHKHKNPRSTEAFSLFSLLWITAGAFFIFIIFCVMLLRRASLGELSQTFLYNFRMPGYEQNPSQWMHKLSSYFRRVYKTIPYLVWSVGAACVILPFDKRRFSHALWYLLPSAAAVVYYLCFYGLLQNHVPTNFCAMPLAFLGFLCFWLLPEKDFQYLFLWFIPGVLYSLCSHFASDTGILCITSSYILCSSIGALFLYQLFQAFVRESAKSITGKAASVCILAALAVHITVSGCLRITFFYNEEPLPNLTAQVHTGPAKGLFTSPGMAAFHEERVSGLKSLPITENDTLLVMAMEPWAYLCTEASCASYTCWGMAEEPIYRLYLSMFPEKYPTVIYCTDLEKALEEEPLLMQEFLTQGYEVITLESAAALLKKKI
ncbi:MAG: hypothetical protein HFI25_02290 [Lachnospiraceae bacterium]|nr:hypothetical protein [Lachnospiraceae bacterium]